MYNTGRHTYKVRERRVCRHTKADMQKDREANSQVLLELFDLNLRNTEKDVDLNLLNLSL